MPIKLSKSRKQDIYRTPVQPKLIGKYFNAMLSFHGGINDHGEVKYALNSCVKTS